MDLSIKKRNTATIQKGDIQTRVELGTIGGQHVTTVITNDSLQGLELKLGKLITAEVKAPCVLLQKSANEQGCSDGTEVYSIVTSESCRRVALVDCMPSN